MKPQVVLTFDKFPAAIAQLQEDILKLRQDLRIAKESEALILVGLQSKVANNPELTNDTKRKAELETLKQQDKDLLMTRNEITALEHAISEREIALELRRNEFAVMKLDMRLQIATLMVQVEAA